MALGDDSHEPTRRNWLSFWCLMGLQAQNAFNDKALHYTLLPLGVWIASNAGWGASFAHVLGILMLAPFILFAPVAGWIGDNFSKTRVIRFAAWLQLAVLLVVLTSFGPRRLLVGVVCLFFLSLQSTILIALTAIPGTWYANRLLPRSFVKLLVMNGLRAFYRIEAIGVDRLPAEGGVLLTTHDNSALDALILSAASPRPVRFLMISRKFERPLVRKIAKLCDIIPVPATRAEDAIQMTTEALEEGCVVSLGREGDLLSAGDEGFALIARRARGPVLAVSLDERWKLASSPERGKSFWGLPRRDPSGVRVAFSNPPVPDGV